jgi:hypothetical protein
MHIQVTFPSKSKVDGLSQEQRQTLVEVQVVEDGPIVLVVDPGSWAAVAIYFFEKFASSFTEAAGKELGTAFGKWLAERLGFGSSSADEARIKAILDEFVRRVVAAIKAEFREDQFRRAHEGLAGTSRKIQGYLLAPKTETLASLNELDLAVGRVYEEVKNLGESALPSLCRAGTMLITISFRLYGKSGDAGQRKITLDRVNEVLSDIERLVSVITKRYGDRVIGPYSTEIKGYCKSIDTPNKRIPIVEEVRIPAWGVRIDGAEELFRRRSDPCGNKNDLEAGALAEAAARADAARQQLDTELQREFLAPVIALKQSAAKLAEKLKGKGK